MKIESQSHMKNEIWTLTKFSKNKMIIIDRWVFKIKYNLNDSIFRYKTRWVVHEFKQMKNVDFNSIWIEVVKSISFRTLFVIATARNLHILQLNIVTTFLYDQLDEDIYVNQFNDFIENLTLVCHLRKTLYDFKQTSRVWYAIIKKFLKNLRFIIIFANQSIFCREEQEDVYMRLRRWFAIVWWEYKLSQYH